MSTRCRPTFDAACHSLSGVAYAGAVILISLSVQAENLFVSCSSGGTGSIYNTFTPDGARSAFATGVTDPIGLAFNGAGDLFEADYWSGNIYKFTPGEARSTFASGLSGPMGVAFNSAGNLFVADYFNGSIYEFTPGGAKSTFASGLTGPIGLAFEPVPEPSALGLLALIATAVLVRRSRLGSDAANGREMLESVNLQ